MKKEHIGESELILNPDGSIYHLSLKPFQLADNVILVGDPERVNRISQHFDHIEYKVYKREFVTHTGIYNNNRITVISTGIGPDNIDIVLNEIDALVNMNFETRKETYKKKSLNIIRIGTSGAIDPNIDVDSFVLSDYALGFDQVLHYYKSDNIQEKEIQEAFLNQSDWNTNLSKPLVFSCSSELRNKFSSEEIINGFTATAVGFYGPQARVLRLKLADDRQNEKLENFDFKGLKITNYEMETSTIYGLGKLLGHKCLSLNCIIANRKKEEFSSNPYSSIDKLIKYTLDKI